MQNANPTIESQVQLGSRYWFLAASGRIWCGTVFVCSGQFLVLRAAIELTELRQESSRALLWADVVAFGETVQ